MLWVVVGMPYVRVRADKHQQCVCPCIGPLVPLWLAKVIYSTWKLRRSDTGGERQSRCRQDDDDDDGG